MSDNNNNINITKIEGTSFSEILDQINTNFQTLAKGHYLYKGDNGSVPMIVEISLYENNNWTEVGEGIIMALFGDEGESIESLKLRLNTVPAVTNETTAKHYWDYYRAQSIKEMKYAWWGMDGDEDLRAFPVGAFMFVDSTPNDKKTIKGYDGSLWEDKSCMLVPKRDKDENVIYEKSSAFPTFYFNDEKGLWCWKVNGTETTVPASIANDDTVLGKIYLMKDGKYFQDGGYDDVGDLSRKPIKGDLAIVAVKDGDINQIDIQYYNGSKWVVGEGGIMTFNNALCTSLLNSFFTSSSVKFDGGIITVGEGTQIKNDEIIVDKVASKEIKVENTIELNGTEISIDEETKKLKVDGKTLISSDDIKHTEEYNGNTLTPGIIYTIPYNGSNIAIPALTGSIFANEGKIIDGAYEGYNIKYNGKTIYYYEDKKGNIVWGDPFEATIKIIGENNTVGKNCSNITVNGNGNVIGDNCDGIYIQNGNNNVIGNSCNNIVLWGDARDNTIGNNCSYINYGFETRRFKITSGSSATTYAYAALKSCVIGDNVLGMSLASVDSGQTSDNSITNIYVMPGYGNPGWIAGYSTFIIDIKRSSSSLSYTAGLELNTTRYVYITPSQFYSAWKLITGAKPYTEFGGKTEGKAPNFNLTSGAGSVEPDSDITILRCPDCGTPYDEGAGYCIGCGRKLTSESDSGSQTTDSEDNPDNSTSTENGSSGRPDKNLDIDLNQPGEFIENER